MVNVTKLNFIEESNDLLQHLNSATFVAIDEEMTGIRLPNSSRPRKDDTPALRYEVLREVPERYSIVQLGICLFHENPSFRKNGNTAPEFQVRRYNFFLFPPTDNSMTREVVLNPSAVAFLNEHNMNFDLWSKEGIPFVTTEMAEKLLSNHQRRQKEKFRSKMGGGATKRNGSRRRLELRRPEDIDFHARAMAGLREWLDAANPTVQGQQQRPEHGEASPVEAIDEEGVSFLLPPCNSFLRMALYESIQTEYPALVLENAGGGHYSQIRVLRLNQEERRRREERLQKESWEDLISSQIGMWRVFTALSLACQGRKIPSDSIAFAQRFADVNWNKSENLKFEPTERRVPIIVHNGYMDLFFLMTHFHAHILPKTYEAGKALISRYFPVIYDTKVLCTECTSPPLGDESTNLQSLFGKIVLENDDVKGLLPETINNYDENQAHEASYDAYMTGAVFLGISQYIIKREKAFLHSFAREGDSEGVCSLFHLLAPKDNDALNFLFGRNKLSLTLTMYTIDLEDPSNDPLSRGMLAESTFRVSEFDPSVTTRTIIDCLSGIDDSRHQRVNFEIVWVDDTTFLVSASYKPSSQPIQAGTDWLIAIDETKSVLREHGKLVLKKLKERFPTGKIVRLDHHLQTLVAKQEQEQTLPWTTRLGLFVKRSLSLTNQEVKSETGHVHAKKKMRIL